MDQAPAFLRVYLLFLVCLPSRSLRWDSDDDQLPQRTALLSVKMRFKSSMACRSNQSGSKASNRYTVDQLARA